VEVEMEVFSMHRDGTRPWVDIVITATGSKPHKKFMEGELVREEIWHCI
jgi:hypothetical protein